MAGPSRRTTGARRLSRPKVLAAVALVAALAGGVYGYKTFAEPKPAAATTQLVKAAKGNLRLSVNSTGTVKTPRAADLSFGSGGVVQEVYVQAGDAVKQGQPLAKLEPRTLELRVSAAQIALRSAEINLQSLIAAARPEDVASARASLESARARLDNMNAQGTPEDVAVAEASVKNASTKLENLLNPLEADVAQARAAVESARVNLMNAETRLGQLRNPTDADRAAADAAVASARAAYDRIKNPTASDLASARAAVDTARANLATQETRLNDLRNPPPDKLLDAQTAVANAENALRNARDTLSNMQTSLSSDEKRRTLVEAYVQLYIAREDLATVKVSGTPEEIAKREQQLILALKGVDAAEADVDYPTAGVTAQQWRSAQGAVDTAVNNLATAQYRLQVLVQPLPSDLANAENSVSSAKASLSSAEAKLAQLVQPSPSDILSAESAVKSAEAKWQQLVRPTPADLAAAEGSVSTAAANLESAVARLNLLLNPSETDVAVARAAVTQAETQLDKTRIPYKEVDLASQRAQVQQAESQLGKVLAPGSDLDIARSTLNVDKARLDLEQAQYDLEQSVLRAPFDGIVSKVSVTPGVSQGIGSSTVVMSVLDPSSMQVEVNVDETDVAKVELNQPVQLTVEAAGQRPYQGRVVAIAPSATVQSGVTSYLTTISVQNPQGLRQGMTAVAAIVYQQRQNVLLVPSRAVKSQGRERTVQLMVNGVPETRKVTVGLSDDTRTEITEGLQEGDEVLVETGRTAGATGQNQRLPGAGGFGGGLGGGAVVIPGGAGPAGPRR